MTGNDILLNNFRDYLKEQGVSLPAKLASSVGDGFLSSPSNIIFRSALKYGRPSTMRAIGAVQYRSKSSLSSLEGGPTPRRRIVQTIVMYYNTFRRCGMEHMLSSRGGTSMSSFVS
jgi:hypothetical protein